MAAIQKAALTTRKDRKQADILRIKAGHLLTLDHLASSSTGITERHVARRVLRKSMVRSTGCMSLPLTIAYFGFYVTSVRLHEDITSVYFLESSVRDRLDAMFAEAHTIESVWDALLSAEPGMFMSVFFPQTEMHGQQRATNVTGDMWGDHGRIFSYSQIQGAVEFKQSRVSTGDFGKPYSCDSDITCKLCSSNEGFQTIHNTFMRLPIERVCNATGRRLPEEGAAEAELSEFLAGDEFHPRRLHLGRPELRSSFPIQSDQKANDTFRFWLYPAEASEQTSERLRYFADRAWLDQQTELIQIRMYIMNAELGRNRLEQLTVTLRFSEAGNVYYESELQPYFLQFFYGNLSLAADGMFLMMLVVNSAYRLHAMWKAFLRSKLFHHLINLHMACEWLMIWVGWWTMVGYYHMMFNWEPELLDALKPVHRRGWELGPERIAEVENLFVRGQTIMDGLASLRVLVAQYSVMLMFRFFVSFGSQPRLAVVLNTMLNVLTDLFHFMIVFVPTAFAYVIAGSIIFGRRMQTFATILSSLGTCFRIAMESEYVWEEMSAEFYWAAALWAWSFLSLVVLLFLNIVLAIILDIYRETRESSFPGEAVWETVSYFMTKGFRFRAWVADRSMEEKLEELGEEESMVEKKLIEDTFPRMPDFQKASFFKACRAQMRWESTKDLTKPNLLKVIESVMDSLQHSQHSVQRIIAEEAKDPVKPWTTAKKTSKHDKAHHTFLKTGVATKGGKEPVLQEKESTIGHVEGPEWLQETWELLRQQRRWIKHNSLHLQQVQCQIQEMIESRPFNVGARPSAGGL